MKQEVTSPQEKPLLDFDSFQQLLSAAYVIQEQNDVESRKTKPDHAQALAELVETQKRIQTHQLELSAAATLIAERLQKITQAAGVAVGVVLDDQISYPAAVGTARELAGSKATVNSSLAMNCIRHGEILQCPEAEADFRLNPDLCSKWNVKALIAVPVYHEAQIAGVLEVWFSDANAFAEQDVRSCQLMGGLVAEAIARGAEHEWKQALAVERATMLEALEKIKPQLQKLAENPPVDGKGATPASAVCRCGNSLRADESFCGLCGAPREKEREKLANRDMQSKVASLWHMQQAALMQKGEKQGAGPANVSMKNAMALVPPQLEGVVEAIEPSRDVNSLATSSLAASRADSRSAPTKEESKDGIRILPADHGHVPATATYPWISANQARQWLDSIKPQPGSRDWFRALWRIHRANIYLGAAVILLLTVFISALAGWGSPPVPAANASSKPGARVHDEPQLSLFEKALIGLGLAEAPSVPVPVYSGNPNARVWVDTRTALYYCPGSDLYGKTPGGKLTTQRDAQLDQYEPDARKFCN